MNAVIFLDSSSSGIWWYAERRSISDMYFDDLNASKISAMIGIGFSFLFVFVPFHFVFLWVSFWILYLICGFSGSYQIFFSKSNFNPSLSITSVLKIPIDLSSGTSLNRKYFLMCPTSIGINTCPILLNFWPFDTLTCRYLVF